MNWIWLPSCRSSGRPALRRRNLQTNGASQVVDSELHAMGPEVVQVGRTRRSKALHLAGGAARRNRHAEAVPAEWVEMVTAANPVDQRSLAADLVAVIEADLAAGERRLRGVRALLS